MKTRSSEAGAMSMKKRYTEPEQCHFYDDCATLDFGWLISNLNQKLPIV